MTTAVVLFTRDLRVHDQPALAAACRRADRVVPLFVFDEAILGSSYAASNRLSALLDSVAELRCSLRARGGDLIVRRGTVAREVHDVVVEVAADELHLSADVSGYARGREDAVRRRLRDLPDGGPGIHLHPGILLVQPEELETSSGGNYMVFSAYHRRWAALEHRGPVPAPSRVATPPTLAPGELPTLEQLLGGEPTDHLAPHLPPAGEPAARQRADAWFDGPIDAYGAAHDLLADDVTSRLSPHLHLGTISVAELAARVDRSRPGHEAFLRQLCWRDFNHQLLAARPDLPHVDLRDRGDRWHEDEDASEAWRQGRTGYPVVDAGMRQLAREGWMHNRARMLVASFLTKHLYLDWRLGAQHFLDHLVDGDLANNSAQWQWVAGTGSDPRPNRVFNPVTQSRRYDPDGSYLRRYLPELADVDAADIHAPWREDGTSLVAATGYPPPIVDHAQARERFLAARGR